MDFSDKIIELAKLADPGDIGFALIFVRANGTHTTVKRGQPALTLGMGEVLAEIGRMEMAADFKKSTNKRTQNAMAAIAKSNREESESQ